MNKGHQKIRGLESLLAILLHYGTWLATAVIGLGLILPNMPIVNAGIGLFILLPFLRVVLMLIVFARQRDYRFVIISAIVLLVILLGLAIGALHRVNEGGVAGLKRALTEGRNRTTRLQTPSTVPNGRKRQAIAAMTKQNV
jgi:hypothetical protein